MSNATVIPWLPVDPILVAPLQSLAAPGNLILNSRVTGQPQGNFIYDRVIRKVSLTSTNNLSGVNFTIKGIGSPVDAPNQNPIEALGIVSETIGGPNNNTVNTDNIYSQVISISADSPANGISAGSGPSGITDYVFLDYNRTIFQTAVQLQFVHHDSGTVTVYQSLTKPYMIDINYGNLIGVQPIPAFEVSGALKDAITDQIGILLSPVALTWANIKDANTDVINFTVLQQGTRS